MEAKFNSFLDRNWFWFSLIDLEMKDLRIGVFFIVLEGMGW